MGNFDKIRREKKHLNILYILIFFLVFVVLFMAKGLISVSSNKTVVVQVPQIMEAGEYRIGALSSSESVYKMWSKVWINEIGNFDYGNVRKKVTSLFPFLGGDSVIDSKSKLIKFISFNEKNFITQNANIKDIMFEQLRDGFVKVTVLVNLHKKIGKKVDAFSGMLFAYELTLFTRNGQVYISGISTKLANSNDPAIRSKLKALGSVNLNESLIANELEDEELKKRFAKYKRDTLDKEHKDAQARKKDTYDRVKEIKKMKGGLKWKKY